MRQRPVIRGNPWSPTELYIQGHRLSPRPGWSAPHVEGDSFTGWLLMTSWCCPSSESEGSFLLTISLTAAQTDEMYEMSISASPCRPIPWPEATPFLLHKHWWGEMRPGLSERMPWEFTRLLSPQKLWLKGHRKRKAVVAVPHPVNYDIWGVTSK